MSFYLNLLDEVSSYMEKNPGMPPELVMAYIYSKKIRGFRISYNKDIIKQKLLSEKRVSEAQFFSDDEIKENITKVEKFYKDVISSMVRHVKNSHIKPNTGVQRAHRVSTRLYEFEDLIYSILKTDGTDDAERYNKRILNSWYFGSFQDKYSMVTDLLAEMEQIDMSKWFKKDNEFIMEHFDEFKRDYNMVATLANFYDQLTRFGLINYDKEKHAKYKKMSVLVDVEYSRRVDSSIEYKISPMGAYVQFSKLEKFAQKNDKNLDVKKDDLAKIDEDTKIKSVNYYRYLELTRGFYNDFLKYCEKRQVKVPDSSKEFIERFDVEFKTIDPEWSSAFFETIKYKEKNKCFLWESQKYEEGKKNSKAFSNEDVDNYNSIDIYKDISLISTNFEKNIDSIFGPYKSAKEEEITNKITEIENMRDIRRYKDLIDGVRNYLGYKDNETLPLILGGEANGNLILNADDMEKASMDYYYKEKLYGIDKNTGKIMSFVLDYSNWDTLSKEDNAITEASEEELDLLYNNQLRTLSDKFIRLTDREEILRNLGAEGNSLLSIINAIGNDMSLWENANEIDILGINQKLENMVKEAVSLRDKLLDKSSRTLLSDKEGKAVALCENLKKLGEHACVGVPGADSMYVSVACDEKNQEPPSSEDVLLKIKKICKIFDSTCSGFRNDSVEFKTMHSSAKTIRDHLIYAEKNGIKVNSESLCEEYRKLFTSAKDYLNYRNRRETKNGRTQTRISCAKDIEAMGDALGCKRLTMTELAAHKCADEIIDSNMKIAKNNPNSTSEKKYLQKCLTDRREANSVIRNNKHFCSVVAKMSEDELYKVIDTKSGFNVFSKKIIEERENYKEAERKKTALNPNAERLIKDTDLFMNKWVEIDMFVVKLSNETPQKAYKKYVLDFFVGKLMQKTLEELGEQKVHSEAELKEKLNAWATEFESEEYNTIIRETFSKISEKFPQKKGIYGTQRFIPYYDEFEKTMLSVRKEMGNYLQNKENASKKLDAEKTENIIRAGEVDILQSML